jgi:hypothetical protein
MKTRSEQWTDERAGQKVPALPHMQGAVVATALQYSYQTPSPATSPPPSMGCKVGWPGQLGLSHLTPPPPCILTSLASPSWASVVRQSWCPCGTVCFPLTTACLLSHQLSLWHCTSAVWQAGSKHVWQSATQLVTKTLQCLVASQRQLHHHRVHHHYCYHQEQPSSRTGSSAKNVINITMTPSTSTAPC